jgi:ATP-dependent DNA helicase RecG
MVIELQYIKGIGPRRASVLEKAGITTLNDLLDFFPRRYLDRTNIVSMAGLTKDSIVTVIGKIESAGIRRARKPFFYLVVSDGRGYVEAIWFNYADRYKNYFKVGDYISLSGKVSFYKGYKLVHPDYDRLGDGDLDSLLNTGKIIPVYPGGEEFRKAGLNSYTFRKIFHSVFSAPLENISEVLPAGLCRTYGFPERNTAYREMHFPGSQETLQNSIKRFKYEEFFFLQMMLALQKKHSQQDEAGFSHQRSSIHLEKLYHALPFEMTAAQQRVVKEIRKDMASPHPMNRLLQGDVGSGKTLVALMAMLIAIDNGFQTALMVPTEVLAEQHFYNISRLLKQSDITVVLLTGNTAEDQRRELNQLLSEGRPVIVIGTHALIQESINFSKLGLVVIDEQHRFGVTQRASLMAKGMRPDVLVMTATPIPRTLALTVYGNLDVSILDEMPPGRIPVKTVWRFDDKAEQILEFIKQKVRNGEQAYIVYPLVEESEKIDLKAATESYRYYQSNDLKDFRTALLHGRMKSEDKEKIMQAFSRGEIQILFATTVIEVGLDVANATIMLIEHAERLGLSQLHQLRGRVGRGSKKSYCILKSDRRVGETARSRLRILTESSDGFRIAEEDLKLRGWGEFFGTRQHGLPAFKIANPLADQEILQQSRRDAFNLIEKDPQLREPEDQPFRKYFFERYAEKIAYFKIS